MPSRLDTLIRIYGSRRVDDVPGDPEYQSLCERYKEDRTFHAERDRVETVKRRLEDKLEKAAGLGEQVKQALIEINKRRRHAEQELLHKLIDLAYKPAWSTEQQDYYGEAWRLLQAQHDFFFSFTTRHYPPDTQNLVNAQYEHFIRRIIGSPKFKTADRSKENLLAQAVYQLLAQSRHGFMFTLYQNDNSETERKLREACSKSIVFVQLVQNIMFEEPSSDKTNYCYFEYLEAQKAIPGDRFLFVVAQNSRDALVLHRDVPPPYETWHGHVFGHDAPYLEESGAQRNVWLLSLETKIKGNIAGKLERLIARIFESVPQ